MNRKDFHACSFVFEYQCFTWFDPFEKIDKGLVIFVIIRVVIILNIFRIFQVNIVVSIKHDKTVLVIKTLDGLEHSRVRINNVLEFTMFPQLVSVACLHIHKTSAVIIFKGVEVYICLLYTSPSPRDGLLSRMPSSA